MTFPDMSPVMVERLATAARVLVIIVLGLPLLRMASHAAEKVGQKRYSEQTAMLMRKGIFYTGVVVLIVVVLGELGFKLGPLLGAAGVFGIAIGFASKTSVSNIISGLFLLSERPFQVGDVISVGAHTGTVLSIDLLSVKLRLFDNRFVRIPNETLINAPVINVTRFPIRRFDLTFRVGLTEDLDRACDVIKEAASANPLVLDEPSPTVLPTLFGESGVDVFCGVWFAKDDFPDLKKTLLRGIKSRLDEEGIRIPLPHRVLVGDPGAVVPGGE